MFVTIALVRKPAGHVSPEARTLRTVAVRPVISAEIRSTSHEIDRNVPRQTHHHLTEDKDMADSTTQPIRRGESYRKDQFLDRSGMKEAGYRSARRQGLKTIETAGRVYITGDAWHEYLDSLANELHAPQVTALPGHPGTKAAGISN